MGAWDLYQSRADAHGNTKRKAELKKEQRMLLHKTKDSLSYFDVLIEGEERSVSIIDSDNLNEKKMLSLPGEDFDCGALVEWADNRWLITEKDAHNEVYTRVKLLQCNYLLKWVDELDEIHEQWCVIEDGTKLSNWFPRSESCVLKHLSNCWDTLKQHILQRKNEIYLNVNVAKAERNMLMA